MGYSRRSLSYSKRIILFNPTHMMSMAGPVAIGVETLRIDSGCSLEKGFTKLIHMNPWMLIIPNYQLSWFMSWLCMWSFDLRHQRYLLYGRSCFDYNLQIPSHKISKTSYIGYDMKSTKMIVWLGWDHPPSKFEKIDSRNEMRWNPWPR